jgi:hypothetical protein
MLNVQYETGLDALQYHRMASAVVRNGLAPWVVNPLSLVGVYPGSDSSGVPFVVAEFSLASGISLGATVLVYDGLLLLVFGLGLFALTRQLTDRTDLAMLAILLGTLAYGFFTTLPWSLDERSFNVALTPMFLFLLLPGESRTTMRLRGPRIVSLGVIGALMFVSHLSFILLLPFVVLVPLLHQVIHHPITLRRKRRASLLYFAGISFAPLLLLMALNQLGILSSFGLEYQLGNSALFSGSSPLIFLANAMIFLGTRVGPVDLVCVVLGLMYLASRPYLVSRNIVIGGLLLAGFLGLPIVLYSKDLLTPIFVVLGAIGLGGLIRVSGRRRIATLGVTAVLIVSGSVAFNAWNLARTSRTADATYWAPPGVVPESQDGNLWLNAQGPNTGCVYGNNPVLLQQVTNEPSEPFCTGLPVDFLINQGVSAVLGPPRFQAIYLGLSEANPGDWFTSPELARMTNDFARLPGLDFQSGRSLLLSYNVTLIVVDMQKPFQIPLYKYQGVHSSLFFTDIWNSLYPIYRSSNLAIFRIG